MRVVLREYGDAVAERVVDRLTLSAPKILHVQTKEESGSALVLNALVSALDQLSVHAIRISPPQRQIDSASVALVDLALGLTTGTEWEQETFRWAESGDIYSRIADIDTWLKEADACRSITLLIDNPGRWHTPEAHEIGDRTNFVIDYLVHRTECTKIIVGSTADLEPMDSVEAGQPSGARLLDDVSGWGRLAEAAARLKSGCPGIAEESAAHLQLAVTYVAASSLESFRSWWSPHLATEVIADRLAAEVRLNPRLRNVWDAWVACALLRRAAPWEWLEPYFAKIASEECLDIFTDGLLLFDDEARLIRQAQAAASRCEPHAFISRSRSQGGEYFFGRYADRTNSSLAEAKGDAFTWGAEALFLAQYADGVVAVSALPIAFPDQYDGVGVLALERGAWGEAASAFRRSLEIDQSDAFATHQLGFTLDCEAIEPREVEQAYSTALELEGSHATWHARLVSFLVVRARMIDAQAQWDASRAELAPGLGDAPLELYERLHLPVASNVLRRAEIGMAAKVLDDVPGWAREQLLGYGEQRERLAALERALTVGAYVPARRALPDWWQKGPELLSDRLQDGRPLQMWVTGGVEAVGPGGINLSAAVLRGKARPTSATLNIPWDTLEARALDSSRARVLAVGDFLEIGYYGLGAELSGDPVIRILPRIEWLAGIDTPLDPGRYLRRSRWLSTSRN